MVYQYHHDIEVVVLSNVRDTETFDWQNSIETFLYCYSRYD